MLYELSDDYLTIERQVSRLSTAKREAPAMFKQGSADRNNWGAAVASGTFNSDRGEKKVMFASKVARYVRFVALSEINGQPWTSVAELNLIGAAQ